MQNSKREIKKWIEQLTFWKRKKNREPILIEKKTPALDFEEGFFKKRHLLLIK